MLNMSYGYHHQGTYVSIFRPYCVSGFCFYLVWVVGSTRAWTMPSSRPVVVIVIDNYTLYINILNPFQRPYIRQYWANTAVRQRVLRRADQIHGILK